MKLGDCVLMSSCTVVHGDKQDKITLSYKAPKGRRLVFMLLGDEPADGSNPLEPDVVLDRMGWQPKG